MEVSPMKLLKQKVKDNLTGYEGIVTGFAMYATQSAKILVEAVDSTGRPIEWWVDAERIELIKE